MGQNYRRIKFNIHIWGFQFDGGIVSNSGNPQLVWNLLGKSRHHSEKKHKQELIKRGIVEFEIPISNKVYLAYSVKEMTDYVRKKRLEKIRLTMQTIRAMR